MITKRVTSALTAAIVAFGGMGINISNLGIRFLLPAQANSTELAPNNLSIADQAATRYTGHRGRFRVFYNPVQNPSYKSIEALFLKLKFYEKFAYAFNKNLDVPRDINILSTECGKDDAFYNQSHHAIVICYELIGRFAKFGSKFATSQQDLYQAVIGMTMFTFFHELGHTLIHELDLPAVGREEDVADQLAVVILTATEHPIGEISLVSVATMFKEFGETTPAHYWDVHPLDRQRYYNIICLLYGSNPSKYASLPIQAGLPGTRAQGCPSEYKQARKSWVRLLELSQKSLMKPISTKSTH